MNIIPVIIIDDHPLFLQGVTDALSLEPDLRVIAQASSGEVGLELIRTLQPMVAVVDVNLPGLNGQQLTRLVISEKIPTRIILLTAYDDTEQKIHAMRVGAAAYCTKDVRPEELVNIIRVIAPGRFVVGDHVFDYPGLERWLNYQSDGAMRSQSDLGDAHQALSGREMEVLTYVTKGKSNKEIALLLKISQQTVKNHVTAILRKLGVDDRTQAALYALRRGWVRLHQDELHKQE